MHIDVFTVLPQIPEPALAGSLLCRARERGVVDVRIHDLRHYTTDRHRSVDDSPFGGGAGMVLAPEPVFRAVEAVQPVRPLYLLDPGGRRFDQAMAAELAAGPGFSLLCGRYEGVDERVRAHLVDGELSIGDFVLTGGEIPAMVVVDAVARLVPGVIDPASIAEESHDLALVESPHYTRPAVFRGHGVPEVLLSGHHAEIARWRREQSIRRTAQRRPDLLSQARLSGAERDLAGRVIAESSAGHGGGDDA